MHGKQKELDRLKAEETELLQDIKHSEKEIERLEHDLNVAEELKLEVGKEQGPYIYHSVSALVNSI